MVCGFKQGDGGLNEMGSRAPMVKCHVDVITEEAVGIWAKEKPRR